MRSYDVVCRFVEARCIQRGFLARTPISGCHRHFFPYFLYSRTIFSPYERQQSFYEPRDIYRSYIFTAELSAYHLVPPLDFDDTPRLRTSRTAVYVFRVPIRSVTIGFSSYETKPTRKKRLDFGTIDPRSVLSLDNEIQHAHRGQNCNPSREQAYTS